MEKFELRDICNVVEHLRVQSEVLDGMCELLYVLTAHSQDIPEAPSMNDSWVWVMHDLTNKTWKMKKVLIALEKSLYEQSRASNPQTSADLQEGGKRK